MKKYYFTFGCDIDNPHRNCFTVIEAVNEMEARSKMISRFGNKWAFLYAEPQWYISPENQFYKSLCAYAGLPADGTSYTQDQLYHLTQI